jgi:hypothetical protein
MLAAPEQPVLRLLSLAGLIDWLPVFASLDQAVSGNGRPLAPGRLAGRQAGGRAGGRAGKHWPGKRKVNPAGMPYRPPGAVGCHRRCACRKAAPITCDSGRHGDLRAAGRDLRDDPAGFSRPGR